MADRRRGNPASQVLRPKSDIPTTNDELKISSYAEALATFAMTCETPMTIAIQGDWGTGKTSLMNLVQQTQIVQQGAQVIEFNTWQYAQFNLGDDLPLALLEHLIERLYMNAKANDLELQSIKQKLNGYLRAINFAFRRTLIPDMMSNFTLGATTADLIGELSDQIQDANHPTNAFRGRSAIMEGLRATYEDYVNLSLARFNDKLENIQQKPAADSKPQTLDDDVATRFLIMIDDLDRLPPIRAVEVMEALKLFLDVPGCVFILAIDFDVVRQGVTQKFGPEFDQRKAMAFFDKIIQVPFHMPVRSYQIDDFFLKSIHMDPDNNSDADDFIKLAQLSSRNNPRSLKRLANTYLLLTQLLPQDDQKLSGKAAGLFSNAQLFAAVCLQTSYPLYYSQFLNEVLSKLPKDDDDNPDSQNESLEKIESIFRREIAFFEDVQASIATNDLAEKTERLAAIGVNPIEAQDLADFLIKFREQFTEAPSPNDGANISIDIDALGRALRMASITGTVSDESNARGNTLTGPEALTALGDVTKNSDLVTFASTLHDQINARLGEEGPIGVRLEGRTLTLFVDKELNNGRFCVVEIGLSMARANFGLASQHSEENLQRWTQELHENARDKCQVLRYPNAAKSQYEIVIKGIKGLETAPDMNLLATILVEVCRGTRENRYNRGPNR